VEPFLGQILTVPYNFAPLNWAFCQGQLVPVNQNTALFSLLGTNYGGNGQTTFGLPNMSGRVVLSAQGSTYALGEVGGNASVTLSLNQMPSHNHGATFSSTTQPANVDLTVSGTLSLPVTASGQMQASSAAGTDNDPQSGWTLGALTGTARIYAATGTGTAVPLAAINSTGTASGPFSAPASGQATVPVSGNVTVSPNGGGLPVPTMPPYIVLNNVIAMQGIFPSRS
jgi:microcystin-dependent protein